MARRRVAVLISGGGSNLQALIDAAGWTLPPLFRWLAEAGRLDALELLRTFNCGIGMVLVVASGQAAQVAAVLQEAGETVTPIGRIVPRRDAGVIYRGSIAL